MEGALSLPDDARAAETGRTGSGTDFEARFEAEMPALRGYVRALIGRTDAAADVDDVVQEVLARTWRSRAGFDPARPLQPWLRTTALRTWIDLRARRLRRTEVEESHTRERSHVVNADTASVLEQHENLERLLADLAPLERDVLLRFHRHGESVREIAAALGLASGTVKSHLHRGRRKLAQRGLEETR